MIKLTAGQRADYARQLAKLGVEARALADTLQHRELITPVEGVIMRNAGADWADWAARIDPDRRVR